MPSSHQGVRDSCRSTTGSVLFVIPRRGRGAATHQRLAEWERQQYSVLRARARLITVVDDVLPYDAPELLTGTPAQRDKLRHALRSL